MEEKQTTVAHRAFTSVTETVFPGTRSLKHISRERVVGTGIYIIIYIVHAVLVFAGYTSLYLSTNT